MKLLEHLAKDWLRARGLPVPEGRAAGTAEDAAAIARSLGGRVAVKALVAAGRRGKAGAVRIAGDENAARAAAVEIIGIEVAGQRVTQVYVESAVDIASEFYLSFGFGRLVPQIVVSRHGGIDIEAIAERDPSAIIRADIDPLRGLTNWQAAVLWDRAGIESCLIPAVATLTAKLYDAFRAADALMLEVNPLALTRDDALSVVGTMMEIDRNALFRHAEWQDLGLDDAGPGGRALNARERSVVAADRKFAGGAIRYTELDGDIALFVSGGGAGLLQHDLLLAAGGRPANHSDLSPTSTTDKPAALFDAMFANPNARGLLVGFNFLQLAPCDLMIEALLISIRRNGIDPLRFPIVVRLFGPREDEARRLASGMPGIRYLPHGASLAEAVREIVAAVNTVREGAG
ncbi:MAG: acetate--CoA ligase family protein [Betaproteobacteria bacterium]|nr:acetate--CoA ligase family protein [Betaproteobacteria bacterium]